MQKLEFYYKGKKIQMVRARLADEPLQIAKTDGRRILQSEGQEDEKLDSHHKTRSSRAMCRQMPDVDVCRA